MQKAILGKKLGMTQVFTEDGLVIPVTVIEAGPITVTQKKTVENDGYEAIQVGYTDVKEVNLDASRYALAKEYDTMGIMHIIVYNDGNRLYGVINSFESIKDLALCVIQMNNLYCELRN